MTANDSVDRLIEMAISEDMAAGDVTSQYFIDEEKLARGWIVVKSPGVASGVEVAARVFQQVDPRLDVEILIPDGSRVGAGALLMKVEGSARSILGAERTALNFLQHLSGVATLAAAYVDAVDGTKARILDTRKTTPGYRYLEKQAVRDGGATNHRMALHDRVMIKDNHWVAADGLDVLQSNIMRLKADRPEIEVELEADSLQQVSEFLELRHIDYILLDNMSLDELRAAVTARGEVGPPWLEASGGINLQSVRDVAETGVDFISVGALTHSAPALDIGMDFVSVEE
ncbi:MAG: carboxylating nicotinate-nucleotide diphosphorylase [Luteolibacter sp.]